MVDDADPATIYRARVVNRSRKLRTCEECRRPIAVGERYHMATMLYDDYWSTYATCEHCMACQRWLNAQCGGFLHGGVQEDLEEHRYEWVHGSQVTLLRLIVGMRRQWRSFKDPNVLMAVRA